MTLDEMVADRPDLFTGLYRLGEPRRAPAAVTYQVETLAVMRRDISPLIERHYQEIASFKDVQKLDPDWDAYAALEQAGKLWVLSARADGVLVGYIVLLVGRSLHYKGLLMASEDIHYLLPEYRKGMTGYRLLSKAKQAMQERGIKLLTMRCKAAQSHAALFERLDGQLQDLVYGFRL